MHHDVDDLTKAVAGSFRDPSGYVLQKDNEYYRVINPVYGDNWEAVTKSGFAQKAVDMGLLLPFTELPQNNPLPLLHPQKIPFISYPYEWSFHQLQKAALLTLRLQMLALDFGLILKDASAYNVQFIGSQAVFIDHLSFEKYVEGRPWAAYQQFCKHFYAPLLLAKYRGFFAIGLLRQWIDGIPLDVASRLLPFSTRCSPSILLHIHAHAKMQAKYADSRKSAAKIKRLSTAKSTISNLCQSLVHAIESLSLPAEKTEWGDYYQDTNYTPAGAEEKARIVERVCAQSLGGLALDLGANTGIFSEILARHHAYVLSSDIDPLAVDRNFQYLARQSAKTILPLVLDLANPSPGQGWAGTERASFQARCTADCITALALIHHLVMSAGIPFRLIAEYFAQLLNENGLLLLEFVPKEDSQVQRLLAAREDIFTDYTKEQCIQSFSRHFQAVEEYAIKDSLRSLHVFKKV